MNLNLSNLELPSDDHAQPFALCCHFPNRIWAFLPLRCVHRPFKLPELLTLFQGPLQFAKFMVASSSCSFEFIPLLDQTTLMLYNMLPDDNSYFAVLPYNIAFDTKVSDDLI